MPERNTAAIKNRGNIKKFNDVFTGISFPKKVMQELDNAVITGISIGRSDKKMKIDMELFEIITENCFFELEDNLKRQFPYVSDVEINRTYSLNETIDHKKLTQFWENIKTRTSGTSPICAQILSGSNWETSATEFIIKTESNSAYLLKRRQIDRLIQTMLESIGLHLRVVIKNSRIKLQPADCLSKAKQREQEAAASEIFAISTAPNEQKPNQNTKQQADKEKPYQTGTKRAARTGRKEISINRELSGVLTKLNENLETDEEILIEGAVLSTEYRETKSGKLLYTFDVTDKSSSITIKFFLNPEKGIDEYNALLKKGNGIRILGRVQYDDYSKEITIMAQQLCPITLPQDTRTDNASIKRVELHLHTTMSQMDATATAEQYIKRAAAWGHTALAITDHGVAQAFPEAMDAGAKAGIKIIYGVEAYLVDDLGVILAQKLNGRSFDEDLVVFDLETTGLSKNTCSIIEIGAVKLRRGTVVDSFKALINPKTLLPAKITELTGISDDMLVSEPLISEVLPKFLDFIDGCALAAHNADFDMGFLTEEAARLGKRVENGYLCTVELTRLLFPELGSHKLNVVAKALGVELKTHHRAVDDAAATANILLKCFNILAEKRITGFDGLNAIASEKTDIKSLKHRHAVILAKNKTGLRNLYELISNAHIKYFYKRPRIPKSEFNRLRDGLLIGTACEGGEFYKAILEKKPEAEIKRLIDFYDYLEIQPIGNNMYLYREGYVDSVEALKDINRKIIAYGEKYNKPVVAACDAHFLNPEDEVYRRMIMFGDGYKDADNQPPLFLRTTEEMLAEFAYLGEKKAYEVVVTNTNLISDSVEAIKPIPDGTFPPKIDGADDEIKEITYKKAKEVYGEALPAVVADRLERELESIIKNGFSVMYIIAQKLVQDSVEHGYLVGSRGSVGSSFVATMSGITEVNPLPPHYYCENCRFSDFDSEQVKKHAGMSGCDMPDRDCPVCGRKLKKDGHDIPFETFLGFDGDKEPDIDLNFSGEYQAKAHAYTERLFGSDYVFRAGTIGTLADKTAYGYVKKYLDEHNQTERNAEINRLVAGCVGIKRTTGQHPGGLMVVPKGHSIYEFCPVQRPANDMKTDTITTHFDYHSIHGRLLKLDILGHDVPTIIRMLHDITQIDPLTVDLGGKDVLSLFTSPDALGVKKEDINCATGTLGLPEFGTSFVRQMLLDTRPSSFTELVGISGLSHGTDVWFNNAQDLIADKTATLKEIISSRDGIMTYLIHKGVEKKTAFYIMENVRKGKGLTENEENRMLEAGVPDWYIESCKKIKYLFPLGHAIAYVMMAVRIAHFKIHHPYAFYAALFSVKASDFDYETMCKGKEPAQNETQRIIKLGNDATAKEKSTLTILELVMEMYARQLNFVPLDLYKADAAKFIVTDSGIMPPLCSVSGLGVNAAQAIVSARDDGEFFSIEDFKKRTKTTKTVIELLKTNRILHGLPETNQLTLF